MLICTPFSTTLISNELKNVRRWDNDLRLQQRVRGVFICYYATAKVEVVSSSFKMAGL